MTQYTIEEALDHLSQGKRMVLAHGSGIRSMSNKGDHLVVESLLQSHPLKIAITSSTMCAVGTDATVAAILNRLINAGQQTHAVDYLAGVFIIEPVQG